MNFVRVLAWAFCIIVGGLMITPGGITPIVTNPAVRIIVGVVGVLLGIGGFIGLGRKTPRA